MSSEWEGEIEAFILLDTLLQSTPCKINVQISAAFHAGDLGSIPCMDRLMLKIHFSPPHSEVTKPSSLKIRTSTINSTSRTLQSYKGAFIKNFLSI